MNIPLGVITFLHDLFTVVWIGAMIALALTVVPAAERVTGMGPQTKQLMEAIQRRQSVWAYISMAGLIVTGLLQARRNPAFTGLFTLGSAYSILLTLKHLLVVVMIAVALYRSLVLGRRKGLSSPGQERLNAALLMTNAAFGVVVLLLSGLLTAVGVLAI